VGEKNDGLRMDKNSSRASLGRPDRGEDRGDDRSLSGGESENKETLKSSMLLVSAILARSWNGRVVVRCCPDARRTGLGATRTG